MKKIIYILAFTYLNTAAFAQSKPQTYDISHETIEDVMRLLYARPYAEVHTTISKLNRDAQATLQKRTEESTKRNVLPTTPVKPDLRDLPPTQLEGNDK